ncbi:unnamed protein product [Phytophthora fragariaefolia]|uniref:Unnamed protein product n=1 Tax=Phytophthora fragariaefolia TaxID=1490495 RepID=A0A9W6X7P2_9STRA|nr:unnamed protein product [Phytophthora fragariaefolia]
MNEGKMVYEFKPKIDWNKGKALLWLLQALGLDEHDDVYTIYIGDDTTDEDAFQLFQAQCNRKGVGIVVTEESVSTDASFTLRDTNEVCEFLNRLIACGDRERSAPSSPQPTDPPPAQLHAMATLQVGDEFKDGEEAKYAVQDYALAHFKRVRVARSGGGHKRFVCSSPECGFYVQLYQRKSGKKIISTWYIGSANLEHFNCSSVPKMTSRQLKAEPAFRNTVLSNSSASSREIINQVQQAKGILIPNESIVKRVRSLITEGTCTVDDQAIGYQRLPSLLKCFVDKNPGSYSDVQIDADGRFLRAIVVCGDIVRSMAYNQQIVGVDCARSKNRLYQGQQVLLVGRDGNCDNIIIAVALVTSGDVENYTWFLECLKTAGLDMKDYPVFCDGSEAFRSVSKTYELNVRYCTLHIIRSLQFFKTFTQAHENLIWELQASKWKALYEGFLVLLGKNCGEEVETTVRAIPPERWVLYTALGSNPLYGWRSTNFVENVNATTLVQGFRDKAPYECFDGVMENMAKSLHKRQENVALWTEQKRLVTPAAERLYAEQLQEMGNYTVAMLMKDAVASVNRVGKFPIFRRTVDIEKNTCTCTYMDQYQIPCKHMIAVLSHLGKLDSVWLRFGSCYQVSNYTEAFSTASANLPATSELELTRVLPAKRKEVQQGRARAHGAADDAQLLGVDVEQREYMTLRWQDGKRSKFHLLHLRTWCPCPECSHPTGQRVVNCAEIDQNDLDIEKVFGTSCTTVGDCKLAGVDWKVCCCCTVKGDTLNIVWNDHHESSFSSKWLLENSYSDWALDQHAHDMTTTPLALDAPVPSTEYARMMDTNDDKGLYEALRQVIDHGFTVIRNTPSVPGAVKTLAERIAPISHSYDLLLLMFKVSCFLTLGMFADSSMAMSLTCHVDLAYYESPPGFQFLHALRFDESVKGGESTFVDVFSVAEEFHRLHPEYFATFCRVPATFKKHHLTREKATIMEYQRPHIQLNHRDEVVAVHWSPPFEGPLRVPFDDVMPYYDAYRVFHELVESGKHRYEFRLKQGDTVIFNQRRVLHGRKQFTPCSDGVRHLQGTYINIDDALCRYNVLRTRLGADDPDAKNQRVANGNFS